MGGLHACSMGTQCGVAWEGFKTGQRAFEGAPKFSPNLSPNLSPKFSPKLAQDAPSLSTVHGIEAGDPRSAASG